MIHTYLLQVYKLYFLCCYNKNRLLFSISEGNLLSLIPSGGDNVLHCAHALHLLCHELSGTETVLASVGSQHLLEQNVGSFDTVGGQHLPAICCHLLELLPHAELGLGGLDQALLLEGPLVALLGDCHKGLGLVSKLPGQISNTKSCHKTLKVLTFSELVFARNEIGSHDDRLDYEGYKLDMQLFLSHTIHYLKYNVHNTADQVNVQMLTCILPLYLVHSTLCLPC